MALPAAKGPNDFTFKHSGQPDKLGQSLGGDFAEVQALFDSRAIDNQNQINSVIYALQSTVLNDDGAKNIGVNVLGIAADEMNGAISELYSSIVSAILGQIPNGSLTDIKLSDVAGQIKDRVLELRSDVDLINDYTMERTGVDINGIYVDVRHKRPDGTLYKKSLLSGGTTPKYTTRTVTYYDVSGLVVTKTITYALTYTGDDLTSEVIL